MRQHRVQYVTIHGHRRAFVKVGSGPAVLLLHGLGCDHRTWLPVIDALSRHYTVIAPDLLGHGASDKPRADYSVGGFANGMRDLLTVLGVDKATVVGHSFGGGVAMQFAYQFPERTERLVLVGSGGLGPEVSAAIRAITTTGFYQVMGLLTLPGVRQVGTAGLRALSRTGLKEFRDFDEVDWEGQIVTMSDRAYLTEAMPMCVIWGAEDRVIPTRHAQRAAELAPKARIEILPKSGHFPHKDHPDLFVKVLHDFVDTTSPASYSRARWRRLLQRGAEAPVPLAAVVDGA